jgi:hypothetical protein
MNRNWLAYRPISCLKKININKTVLKGLPPRVLNPPLVMAYKYNNELLAPYLSLDQGDKIQAECSQLSVFFYLSF